MSSALTFQQHPGRAGPFGALLDEYARAAFEFCRVAESFTADGFLAVRPGNDADTVTPRAVCVHVGGAAFRYAYYIRQARGQDFVARYSLDPARLVTAVDTRGCLAEALRLMEDTVEPMLGFSDEEIQAVTFTVRWGPLYDPEMLLEHAVCHLLRHRRQLERWAIA